MIIPIIDFLSKKKLLPTVPNTYPFPDCGKNIDTIEMLSTRRDLQSSRTLALSNLMSEKFLLTPPTIPEDPMEGVKDVLIQQTESHVTCVKCAKKIILDLLVSIANLFYKYAVHYDCIDNSCKKCQTTVKPAY